MTGDFWPTAHWHSANPAEVGIAAGRLANLEREISGRYRTINACLIVRNGALAFERYYNGFGPDDKRLVASVTKSFTSALIGIAIDRGHIGGVEQNVLDFFPEYTAGPGERLKQELTIQHLLTMTAGFQWRTGAHLHELFVDRMRRSQNWVSFILNLPILERSFGTFQYNSAASHLLSAIISRSTGQCARAFAAEQLFTPLGITPPAAPQNQSFDQTAVFRNTSGVWPEDPQGNSIGGWGLFLTPRDMARFGYLYLSRGRWRDVQIISPEWIEHSTRPHTAEYGYQWWLRELKGIFVFSAVGQGGQHIFCIPQKELVVVITATLGSRFRDRWPLLEEFILPAVIDENP